MPPSRDQNGWMARALGVHIEPPPPKKPVDPTIAAALTTKAVKLAKVPRPAAPPRQHATRRVLKSIADKPAPPDPVDAPAHVAEFLGNFLVSVETERPAASRKLKPGAPLPESDQMLAIADLFAAAQRSMIEWENILDQAESAERRLDQLEDQEENRDEAEYAATLKLYNARRHDGMAAEERAMKLMSELQVKFNSLSEAQQAAVLKENRNA